MSIGVPALPAANEAILNTAVIDAMGQTSRYEYDLTGNLTKSTDRNGVEVDYAYSAMGQLILKQTSCGVPATR